MMYLLYGPDTYRSRRVLRELRNSYTEGGGTAVFFFDGEEDAPEKMVEAVRNHPLLETKRVFVCERFFSAAAGHIRALEPFLDALSRAEGSICVFWDAECDTASPEFLMVQSCASEVRSFPDFSGKELREWLDAECVRRGITLSEKDARALLAACGADLWRLSSELAKYELGGEPEWRNEKLSTAQMWDFTDAFLVSKRRALAAAVQLLHGGVDEVLLLGVLGKMLRNAIALGDAVRRRESVRRAAKLLDIHDFVAGKLLRAAEKSAPRLFEAQYALLCEADKNIKTGQLPASLAFLNIFVQ